MKRKIVVEKLKQLGFPYKKCCASVQFTIQNSLLCEKLEKDGEPFVLGVESIEKRGLVLGKKTQSGHKMLYEWNKIFDVY